MSDAIVDYVIQHCWKFRQKSPF